MTIDLKTLSELSILYTQPHRHYHNLNHIHHCLRELDECDVDIVEKNYEEIELFIWFHDAIYDPRSTMNETKSALLFENWFEKQTIQKIEVFNVVYEAIYFTMNHINRKQYPVIDYMLDIDLSILGASTKDYLEYRNNIRQEYSFVDNFDFCNKRIEVLNRFLKKDFIYRTEYFRKKYEEKARRNITKEIIYLKGLVK